MKYNIKLLQEILSKAVQYNETIDLMEYSGNQGLKIEFKDKSVGFPVVTAIEVPVVDD